MGSLFLGALICCGGAVQREGIAVDAGPDATTSIGIGDAGPEDSSSDFRDSERAVDADVVATHDAGKDGKEGGDAATKTDVTVLMDSGRLNDSGSHADATNRDAPGSDGGADVASMDVGHGDSATCAGDVGCATSAFCDADPCTPQNLTMVRHSVVAG